MRITWVILNLSLHFIGIIQADHHQQVVNYTIPVPVPAPAQSPILPPPFNQFQSLNLGPPVTYVQNFIPQFGYREGPPTYKEGPNLDFYPIV